MKLNQKPWLLLALIALGIFVSACGSRSPAATEALPTRDPAMVFTAAANTANARLTEQVAQTPNPPTAGPATATLQPTAAATTAAPTPTLGTVAPPAPGQYSLAFVADLTIPDGTVMAPGAAFTKTWRIQNVGTGTWTPAFGLVFSTGSNMGAPERVPLTVDVAPQQTVDISVNLTAPAETGDHYGYFLMADAAGNKFGLGPASDQPIYVQINVQAGAGTPAATSGTAAATLTATAGPTPTPGVTPGSGTVVSNVTLSVDNANFTGACPHTFTFSASFTLSQASNISYRMEAESSDSSVTINLPSAASTNLGAGTHTLVYTLDFQQSLSGTARLHITAPEDVQSNDLAFTLTCQ